MLIAGDNDVQRLFCFIVTQVTATVKRRKLDIKNAANENKTNTQANCGCSDSCGCVCECALDLQLMNL